MGYGGSRKDAGEAVGQSGDGGIDGIIKEDRLGLDVVYRPRNGMGRLEGRSFRRSQAALRVRGRGRACSSQPPGSHRMPGIM